MKSFPAIKMILVGFILLVGSIVYGLFYAGIPYQDPTATQQASWNFHSTISQIIWTVGLAMIVLGGVMALVKLLFRTK